MPKVIYITDPGDARLLDYSSLTDVALRKSREPSEGLYIAESRKVITRALAAGHVPRSVLCPPDWLDSVLQICGAFGDLPIYVGDADVLESLTGFHIHRGALAAMQRPELPPIERLLDASRTVVVLEDIVDHTNVGAIFRSVAALDADAVLVTPSCADPFYRRSIRVSMGTVLQVPWTRSGGWSLVRDQLHEHGFHIAALALSPDAVDLRDFAVRRPERLAVILGTEGDGLSAAALSAADTRVTIPMGNGVDSLNVAAAAAVALYALQPRA